MKITTFVAVYFATVALCTVATLACTAWLLVEGAPWWGSLLELACGTAVTLKLVAQEITLRQ